MAPQGHFQCETKDCLTRIAILETKVGGGDAGILGEMNLIKRQLRDMELRIYAAGGGLMVVSWVASHFIK